MFRSYQITPRLSIIVKVIVHGTIFSATQRCNVETMLSLLETMSSLLETMSHDVATLGWATNRRCESTRVTSPLVRQLTHKKNEIQPPFLKKKQLIFAMNLPGAPPSDFNPAPSC